MTPVDKAFHQLRFLQPLPYYVTSIYDLLSDMKCYLISAKSVNFVTAHLWIPFHCTTFIPFQTSSEVLLQYQNPLKPSPHAAE